MRGWLVRSVEALPRLGEWVPERMRAWWRAHDGRRARDERYVCDGECACSERRVCKGSAELAEKRQHIERPGHTELPSRTVAVGRALEELGWKGEPEFADSFSARLVGLMPGAHAGEPAGARIMVFWGCGSVHTCFMRAAIDVAFIDGEGCVLRLCRRMVPWRIVACPGAVAVIERLVIGGDERADGARMADI